MLDTVEDSGKSDRSEKFSCTRVSGVTSTVTFKPTVIVSSVPTSDVSPFSIPFKIPFSIRQQDGLDEVHAKAAGSSVYT